MPDETSGSILQILDEDNVYVLLRSVSAGTRLQVGEQTVVIETSLELGHKIAARDIGSGERIIKYGAPIGSAIRDIRTGEHVHLHNIKSDYIPTYTLDSETERTGRGAIS